MARVHTRPLPPESALHGRFGPGDFLDCYAVASGMDVRRAAETITAFPKWARALTALRRILTSPFGLKQEAPAERGDVVGIFPVVSETDDELLAGFDDKHLNFLVSVSRFRGHVHLATWVHPHNLAGRAYLALILPFHIAIARDALRRVAQADGDGPDKAPA